MRLFMFSGQGSQRLGMCEKIYSKFSWVEDFFVRASEILGFDIKEIMFKGPEETLTDTKVAQPAIFIYQAIVLEAMSINGFPEPQYICGHSLGEWTCVYYSKMLNFSDTLKIIKRRGELMAESGGGKKGGMVALIGIPLEEIERVLVDFDEDVVIANYNSPEQFVISGEINKVHEIAKYFETKGKVIPLKVSHAFHSPLMKEAHEEFVKFIDSFSFDEPKIPIISGVDGEISYSKEDVLKRLREQLISPVRWINVLKKAESLGVKEFIEIGPSSVLKGLAKRTLRSEDIKILGISEEDVL